MVSLHVPQIREFGVQLRQVAEERLLTALRDRNQAYVAAGLQVVIIIVIVYKCSYPLLCQSYFIYILLMFEICILDYCYKERK